MNSKKNTKSFGANKYKYASAKNCKLWKEWSEIVIMKYKNSNSCKIPSKNPTTSEPYFASYILFLGSTNVLLS